MRTIQSKNQLSLFGTTAEATATGTRVAGSGAAGAFTRYNSELLI